MPRATSSAARRDLPAGLPGHLAIFAFAAASRLIAHLAPERLEAVLEPRRACSARPSAEEVGGVVRRVERVLSRSEPLLRHHCVTRGLTRYYFLRRAGADVRLVFGIGEIEGRAHGHCWIVLDGRVYGEASDPEACFTPIYAVPASG